MGIIKNFKIFESGVDFNSHIEDINDLFQVVILDKYNVDFRIGIGKISTVSGVGRSRLRDRYTQIEFPDMGDYVISNEVFYLNKRLEISSLYPNTIEDIEPVSNFIYILADIQYQELSDNLDDISNSFAEISTRINSMTGLDFSDIKHIGGAGMNSISGVDGIGSAIGNITGFDLDWNDEVGIKQSLNILLEDKPSSIVFSMILK